MRRLILLIAVLFVLTPALRAEEIPLSGWSSGAELRDGALSLARRGTYRSPRIRVKPSARYRLNFRFYEEKGNGFYLDLAEYAADGRLLPRTDWKRHRDIFLRPDQSLRKKELEMELPFDTQPECASVAVELEVISDHEIKFRDFQLDEVADRPALPLDGFREPDALSMRGPDGILYPDFTRAGVSERRLPEKVFKVRDFDALPDDAADDAAGIRLAVAAAAKAGGGIVQLEPGEYLLYGKVYVDSDRIVIRGAGRGKTRLVSQPPPSGLQIMNLAPGNRIGKNTRLELYFPWRESAVVTLSAGGREILRREIPKQAAAEKFDSDQAYLKFIGLVKESGFSVCQFNQEMGKIILQPRSFLSELPAGNCPLTLEITGWDGRKRAETCEFLVKPEDNYPASHSLIHFEGREYSGAASRMPLAADLPRGGTQLELASGRQLDDCEFLILSAPLHTGWDELARTPLYWGAMRRTAFRIAARKGNSVTLDRPARIPFFAAEGAYATAFHPVRYCTLEGLTLEQRGELQKEFKLNAASFVFAADCEARDIEVIKAGVWPVRFTNVINCTFADSVLRGAWFPRSLLSYAGFEYGTDCLMERLETFDLRHAPLLNWCCSGCVIRESVFHNSDAQLHSGYCLENLFEQCRIIETTPEFSSYGYAFYSTPFNDGMHGSNGPRNVIYNCDAVSRKSSVYLGGNNSQWRIVYNRFRAGSGPGIIARFNCRDNLIAGNLSRLDGAGQPLFFNEYLDNTGNEFSNNTVLGGNTLWSGVKAAFQESGNRFLPAEAAAPECKAPVPSLYLWQKENKSGRK